MKIIICLLFLVVLFRNIKADTSSWTNLHVKFELSADTEEINSFYKIEKTIEDAFENGWIEISNTNDLGLSTVCMSEDELRACALYDRNGILAGMQLAVPQVDFNRRSTPYSFRNISIFEMKKLGKSSLQEYWTSMFLIVSPSTLIDGGRDSIETLGEGLWVKNGSVYTEIPTDERSLAEDTPYRKQNCIPTIGTHYYFNAEHRQSSCNEIQPYYVLVSSGKVHGLGWHVFGRDNRRRSKNTNQEMTRRILETAFPDAPQCFGEWTEQYGMTSVQMYFIDEPWNIRCNQMKDSIIPITGLRRFLLRNFYATNDIINAIARKIRIYIDLIPRFGFNNNNSI